PFVRSTRRAVPAKGVRPLVRPRRGGEAMRAILILALSVTLCCLAASGCADRRSPPRKKIDVVIVPPVPVPAADEQAVQLAGGEGKQVAGGEGKTGPDAKKGKKGEKQQKAEKIEQPQVQPKDVAKEEPPQPKDAKDEPPPKANGAWTVEVKGWGATQ